MEEVNVLYIGGYGRSGSTLLSLILGKLPGFCSVGEVYRIWGSNFTKNELCSCGTAFKSCPFWLAVMEEAFGSLDKVDPAMIKRMQRSIERTRYIPQIAFSTLQSSDYRSALGSYTELLSRLYHAIKAVSKSNVIVDSSKVPTYGFTLSATPTINLYVTHLIRDSRATSYSWQRKKIKPQADQTLTYMPIYSPSKSAFDWTYRNILTQWLGMKASSYYRLRYEDLVVDVENSLKKILAPLGQDVANLSLLSNESLCSNSSHVIGSNPMRFVQGPIKIKADTEWRLTMAKSKKVVITALTLPLLVYYGYGREI